MPGKPDSSSKPIVPTRKSRAFIELTVEFNSLQDAIDGYNDPRYQDALKELGENPEDTVIRNLAIIEGA